MTPWVTRLIIANIAVFFLQVSSPMLTGWLAFQPDFILQAPWSILTYMFAHSSVGHIFFNMFSLFIFGSRVEMRLGGRQFLMLYVLSGIAGAILHTLMTPHAAIIGASGATFGVTYAFAHYWPREPIYLWGVVRIEARWLVIGYAVLSLIYGGRGTDNIAHFAHLGGYLGAFLYLRWADTHTPAAEWRKKVSPPPPPLKVLDVDRWKRVNLDAMHPVNREEYERVLAKLNAAGPSGLTSGDIEFLERFSRS